MFVFTTKSRYGFSAVMEMTKHYGGGPVQVKEIAARHNISPQYLEQLLGRLIKSGLIRAVRGQKGGFVLARAPQEITLVEVLESLEGPLAIVQSASKEDAMVEYAEEAEKLIRSAWDVPLSEVLARQEARALMFHI